MPHPNLKSDFPVSPTLGGQAGLLMDFINMPSPPASEDNQGIDASDAGIALLDKADAKGHPDKGLRHTPTSAPSPRSLKGVAAAAKLAHSALVAERAGIFGSTVVRGQTSTESMRKRLARAPSLSSLPENETTPAGPRVEIVGMGEEEENCERDKLMGLVLSEISRVLETLSKAELRDVTVMLHERYGESHEPTEQLSHAETIKTVVRKKGFEITGFVLNEQENRITLSLLNMEPSIIQTPVPSSAPKHTSPSMKRLELSAPSQSKSSPITNVQQQKQLVPRLRNSVTMTNLRDSAREPEVSTPLYPASYRSLRPTASNGAFLKGRLTIRAVEPSPVLHDTSRAVSPRMEAGSINNNLPSSTIDTSSTPSRGNQSTEENLLLQQGVGRLNIRQGTTDDINKQRADAIGRTLKFGTDLLNQVDKDNANHRAQMAEESCSMESSILPSDNDDRSRLNSARVHVTQNPENDPLARSGRANSATISGSQVPGAFGERFPHTRGSAKGQSTGGEHGNPVRHHRNELRGRVVQVPVVRPNLRHAASLANIRPHVKDTLMRSSSRPAAKPALTQQRSFPTLRPPTKLPQPSENSARNGGEKSGKGGVFSRPTAAHNNKQRKPVADAKKPAGGFGREINWA